MIELIFICMMAVLITELVFGLIDQAFKVKD